MRRVKQAIVVEGKYDAARVRSAVEALVVQTDGFRLFRDKETASLLRRLAAQRGLVILTDSDSAGMVIRNHVLTLVPATQVRHAYIPPVPGKEKRKNSPSREGLLGVEGMDNDIIVAALTRAGATFLDEDAPPERMALTKGDLYALGLSGRADSADRRRALLRQLALPEHLSANRLLEVLGATVQPEELESLLRQIDASMGAGNG